MPAQQWKGKVGEGVDIHTVSLPTRCTGFGLRVVEEKTGGPVVSMPLDGLADPLRSGPFDLERREVALGSAELHADQVDRYVQVPVLVRIAAFA